LIYYRGGYIVTEMEQGNQKQAFLYAYMAGIIDGEGSLSISKTTLKKYAKYSPVYRARIGLGMTDKEIVQLFSNEFGGNIYTESVPNRKLMYRWSRCGNSSVTGVLKILYPYLTGKKLQAELLIEFCEGYVRFLRKRKCRLCQHIRNIHGYGLCMHCYRVSYIKNLKSLRETAIDQNRIPELELLRRETFYQNLKRLHCGEAVATTKRENIRKDEAIV